MPKSHVAEIEIRKITRDYAAELSVLLNSEPHDYSRYFIPFSYDEATITKLLSDAKMDLYFGLFIAGRLAGYYMLRGFDAGYEIPSYGVWIAGKYSGFGIAKMTLFHAVSVCRLNGVSKLMLKVHPENTAAKYIYTSSGFVFSHLDERIGHEVYYKELRS